MGFRSATFPREIDHIVVTNRETFGLERMEDDGAHGPSPEFARAALRPAQSAQCSAGGVIVILLSSLESVTHFHQNRTVAASLFQVILGHALRADPDPAGHNRGVDKAELLAVRECDPSPFTRSKGNEKRLLR